MNYRHIYIDKDCQFCHRVKDATTGTQVHYTVHTPAWGWKGTDKLIPSERQAWD